MGWTFGRCQCREGRKKMLKMDVRPHFFDREVNIAVPKDKVEELEEFAKKCGVEIRKTVEDLTE